MIGSALIRNADAPTPPRRTCPHRRQMPGADTNTPTRTSSACQHDRCRGVLCAVNDNEIAEHGDTAATHAAQGLRFLDRSEPVGKKTEKFCALQVPIRLRRASRGDFACLFYGGVNCRYASAAWLHVSMSRARQHLPQYHSRACKPRRDNAPQQTHTQTPRRIDAPGLSACNAKLVHAVYVFFGRLI